MTDAPARPRILIVDDTPDNVHLLLETLKQDYALMVALSGERALHLLAGPVLPELVLLDVMMPGLDGYEVCRRIKADPRTSGIPVIFVTALQDAVDEERGLTVGAVDYLVKPINPGLVRARLRNHLALRRAQRQVEAHAEALGQANLELQRVIAELKQAEEQRRELLGMAVHDLRNPLAAIGGLASLLALNVARPPGQGMPPEKVAEFIRMIESSTASMNKLITDLLASERLDSGRVQLEMARHELGLIVHSVLDLNTVQAQRKHMELIGDIAQGCFVEADSQRLREVFDNLVSNAIKFSPPGSRILVTVRREADTVCCEVRDQGPGLTAEDRQKLFGRFVRLSAQPTGGETSTGLGLSIVKRLVELHLGTIDVDSEPGEGATFRVRLPLAAAPD